MINILYMMWPRGKQLNQYWSQEEGELRYLKTIRRTLKSDKFLKTEMKEKGFKIASCIL